MADGARCANPRSRPVARLAFSQQPQQLVARDFSAVSHRSIPLAQVLAGPIGTARALR